MPGTHSMLLDAEWMHRGVLPRSAAGMHVNSHCWLSEGVVMFTLTCRCWSCHASLLLLDLPLKSHCVFQSTMYPDRFHLLMQLRPWLVSACGLFRALSLASAHRVQRPTQCCLFLSSSWLSRQVPEAGQLARAQNQSWHQQGM